MSTRSCVVGRELELGRVASLLDRAQHRSSGALVVSGEAGVGKTALLDMACEMAGGMRVLRVRGVESESELPFAALVALLRPVDSWIAGIAEDLVDALRGALGTGPAAPGPPLRIGVALLNLFAGVAGARPLLVVVDDVHWI